jgi:hypothetical protein
MSDCSSVRRCTTLPATATGRSASSLRYYNNELWLANGTSWLPLATRYGRRHAITFTGTAGTDSAFFIADKVYTVVSVMEVHSTAGGASCACQLTKDSSDDAPGAGVDLLTTAFDLTATANTPQTGTLVATAGYTTLAAGDRLSVDFSGTTGSLAGVKLVIVLEETSVTASTTATFMGLADGVFFIADRPYRVTRVSEVHSTACSVDNTVLQVRKVPTGTALTSGTALLATAISVEDTAGGGADANTVQAGALTTVTADLTLAAGDRLAVDFTGAVTALAGCVVTVGLQHI